MGGRGKLFSPEDTRFMARAIELARKAYGATSPNPLVGAVLVSHGEIIGEGWHKKAGEPHAEINALASARKQGRSISGSTLYVTLEPCCTYGRTPPCTEALKIAGVARVVIGATDPNPAHRSMGFRVLRRSRILVENGLLSRECEDLNEGFNHWIARRTPFVALKCAMSLDGKIASNTGESKWITSPQSRAYGMRLRVGVDAILCGINTIIRDDPALTLRAASGVKIPAQKRFFRVILDREARTPLKAKVLSDPAAEQTIIVVSPEADEKRIRTLEERAAVLKVPLLKNGRTFQLVKLLRHLAAQNITSILVEGGGETHAVFLEQKLANRVYFFYAPLVITGRNASKAVAGAASFNHDKGYRLKKTVWSHFGPDLLLTGLVAY